MCPTYDFKCSDEKCNHITTRYMSREDRDAGAMCEACGQKATYKISFPNTRTRNSATFVDGFVDSARKKEFNALYEAEQAKLKLLDTTDAEEAEELKIEIIMKEGLKQ